MNILIKIAVTPAGWTNRWLQTNLNIFVSSAGLVSGNDDKIEFAPWLRIEQISIYLLSTPPGSATVLVPFFLATAVFKVGNLANDGFKIGQSLSTCSVDPACSVRLASPSVLKAFWRHSGPTCVVLHIVIALCLLLPKLMMEARLIQAGFLSKGKKIFNFSAYIYFNNANYYWRIRKLINKY